MGGLIPSDTDSARKKCPGGCAVADVQALDRSIPEFVEPDHQSENLAAQFEIRQGYRRRRFLMQVELHLHQHGRWRIENGLAIVDNETGDLAEEHLPAQSHQGLARWRKIRES
jgi:hypothetical protein